MGDCRDVFFKLQNLPQTALFFLLRENPPLCRMSLQQLAQTCRVARKTMRSYLADLESYGLIRRGSPHSDAPIQILYRNLIDEFVECISDKYVWSPFVSDFGTRSRDEWRCWLYRQSDNGLLEQRETTFEFFTNVVKKVNVMSVMWLNRVTGLVNIWNKADVKAGDFFLLQKKSDATFFECTYELLKITSPIVTV